mgnify:CR=1 FL=1
MDGHDKLKPYRIAIHDCIDGYLRKLMWVRVHLRLTISLKWVLVAPSLHYFPQTSQASHTNNDPRVVARYFVHCVEEQIHCPKLLRTDCGTENGLSAGIQSLFNDSESAYADGKSSSNPRTETLWSELRPTLQDWMEYIWRAFMDLINDTLTEFVTYWNSHRVRKPPDSPGGIPDVLFRTHHIAGAVVPDVKLTETKASCKVSLAMKVSMIISLML